MHFVDLELSNNSTMMPGIEKTWGQKSIIESYLNKIMPKNFVFYTCTFKCFPLNDFQDFLKFNFLAYVKNKNFFKNIDRPEYFLLINFAAEGNKINRIISIIENLCDYFNISHQKVILITGNLENNLNTNLNVVNFNTFQSPTFEQHNRNSVLSTKKELTKAIDACKQNFNGKFFSNLSRVSRQTRSMASCILYNKYQDVGLFSHGKECPISYTDISNFNITPKDFKRWKKSLPIILDKSNFGRNWALDNDYYSIHDQTLFQIVNETLVSDVGVFYTEKTFRPIVRFQPFLIWGQKGINKKLKMLGFSTYENWFDLSFDDIDNDEDRLNGLLDSVSRTINLLKSMSFEEQINWRFNNKKVLVNNYDHLSNDDYNKEQFDLLKRKIRR